MKYPDDFINQIICGDCLEIFKQIPDNSIDTIITDPPYGLSFLGKDWDSFKNSKVAKSQVVKNLGTGMRQTTLQENINFMEWTSLWASEALRIIKPGGTMLCFGGSRTQHLVAFGIELAGWILKDTIMWIYMQSFPKAINIAKNIEKKFGKGMPEAKQWDGWKSHGLKPAYEPIIVAMKPNDGSYVENALKWGVAGLNIDGGRIAVNIEKEFRNYWSEPRLQNPNYTIKPRGHIFPQKISYFTKSLMEEKEKGRYPKNLILDTEAARELDRQSGNNPSRFFYVAKASRAERNMGCEELEEKKYQMTHPQQVGTLEDRYNVTNRNNHPCVKPLKLMKYLCILTKTPTGGIILDPFAGSGTTCIAAKRVGRDFIGIEKEKEYCEIARNRIKAIPEPLFKEGI